MQKPSIGRIVIVPANGNPNNGADEAPAVVTRVWGENPNGWTVNVRVLRDSSTAANDADWRTSVTLCETEDLAREVGTHTAWWPPRV